MEHFENLDWEANAPALDYTAELKKIRRSLRKRNFLVVMTSLVLAAAIAFVSIQYGIPALEKRYWDPNTSTYAANASDLQVTMAVYTELFYPQYDLFSMQITDTGFASFSITTTFSKWVDNNSIAIEIENSRTAAMDRGVLTFPPGFWDETLDNPFESPSFFDRHRTSRSLTTLKEYPEYINLLAAVTFPEDVPVNNSHTLIHELHEIEDLSFIWAAVRTCDASEVPQLPCGYSLRGYYHSFTHDFGCNSQYPYLLGSTSCSVMERHFKSMLQFMDDRQQEGTGILPPDSADDTGCYADALEYIEANGTYIYGGFVIGSPQALLALYESGKINNLYLCDAWLNY